MGLVTTICSYSSVGRAGGSNPPSARVRTPVGAKEIKMELYTESDSMRDALSKAAMFCGMMFLIMLPLHLVFGFDITLVLSTTLGYFAFDSVALLIKRRKQKKISERSWKCITLVPVMPATIGPSNCTNSSITFHYQE